jgi:hypothetical protein
MMGEYKSCSTTRSGQGSVLYEKWEYNTDIAEGVTALWAHIEKCRTNHNGSTKAAAEEDPVAHAKKLKAIRDEKKPAMYTCSISR